MFKNEKIKTLITSISKRFSDLSSNDISNNNSTKKDKKVTKPILWVNGTHAVLTLKNYGDFNIFGGCSPNFWFKRKYLIGLKEYWGLTTREELDEIIEELRAGLHNPRLLMEVAQKGIDKMSKKEFENALRDITSREYMVYFANMYNIYRKFGKNAIMGWDLSRATHLCADGYIVGFYTYEEATTKAIEIGKEIQKIFDSWDDFYESYLFGYGYWSQDDMTDTSSDYYERVSIVADLKKDPESPYRLDWNLDLDTE